jgi:hypothetical protein
MTWMLALGVSGCAAPVASDEEVESRAEALTHIADFQLGIMGIRYDAQGHAFKSTEAWTAPISSMAGLSSAVSDSSFTSKLVNATGYRVAIKSLGDGPSVLQYVDFRLRIQAKDSTNGFIGPVGTTGWASNVGVESYSSNVSAMYYKAGYDQFKIGIEIRWWPTLRVPTELHDFAIGGGACGLAISTCFILNHEEPDPLMSLDPGEISWSHTAGPPDGGPIPYVELSLRTW